MIAILCIVALLGQTVHTLEMRGLQTIVSFLSGQNKIGDNIEEYSFSKGYCFYDFIDYISFRYPDHDCSLYDNEITQTKNRSHSERKPPIMMKCRIEEENGTLIIPGSVNEIISLLKPIGNATKRVEEGSCVLILFYTESCPSCIKIAPIFNILPKLFRTFKIAAIDAYKFSSFNAEFGIVGLPTILLFHQGRPIVKFSSYEQDFVKFITKHTGIKPTRRDANNQQITSTDMEGPLPIVVKERPDYYLFLAWAFIILCACNYFAKSRMCQKIIEMIKRNWHESEIQLEQI